MTNLIQKKNYMTNQIRLFKNSIGYSLTYLRLCIYVRFFLEVGVDCMILRNPLFRLFVSFFLFLNIFIRELLYYVIMLSLSRFFKRSICIP